MGKKIPKSEMGSPIAQPGRNVPLQPRHVSIVQMKLFKIFGQRNLAKILKNKVTIRKI
jgi:hypothetical protein